MNDFLKMDVFFVVATIALVLVTALVCIALWYAIRVLRSLERISLHVEAEAVELRADLDEARLAAKTEARKFLGIVRAFHGSVKRLLGGKDS